MIKIWKKQLQLEWWRKPIRPNVAGGRDVEGFREEEEERGETTGTEGYSSEVGGRGSEETRRSCNLVHDAMEDNVDQEVQMPGPLTPSKREIREKENYNAIGGMRNPMRTLERLTKAREFGMKMVHWWVEFVQKYPEAMVTAQATGCSDRRLEKGVERKDGSGRDKAGPGDERELGSPLQADLWDAWHKQSGDPEKYIGKWAREGCPLGMECEIQTCGIFPEVDEEDQEEPPELEAIAAKKNYASILENREDAEKEILRYVDKGFAIVRPMSWAQQMFEKGTVSKLACITKIKEDHTKKVRIIVDLLRSHGNLRCKVPERIVLPRAVDVVGMGREI